MNRHLLLIIFIIFCATSNAQTKVVAHRGFWKTYGSAQNSLTSLRKADSIRCYGSETDVWITKDGKVIVNHDATYHGVTIENAIYKDVKGLRLSNGEIMPTLKMYLKEAKKLNVHIFLEIKTHKNIERQNACIDATLALAKKMKMEKRITYIAFSLDAIKRLVKEVPKCSDVYYLNGDLSPKELKAIGCTGLDYEDYIILKHLNWIKESHDLGLKVAIGTGDKINNLNFFINNGIDYITTNEPIYLNKLINK